MKCITRATRGLAVLSALVVCAHIAFAEVIHDAANKSVTMSDAGKNLILRLSYDGKCLLDQVRVHGRELVPATTGVCTGIQVAGQWHTTRTAAAPKVTVTGNTVVVKEIVLAGGGVELGEPMVREIANTIARLGIIDQNVIGTNGRYSGFAVLQEQWIAQLGLLIDDPCYFFTGDLEWARRQKEACEKALDFLLARDTNGNGLVEMMTDSHKQQKGCDWIDIVWASFENGLVNAEMYNAMVCWAEVEEQLGDRTMAAKYRECAKKLKECFNRSTTDGGLWDAQRNCYAHWRDKDGSIHGTNLVTPVNFMAIAYAICDDPARQAAILDRIEEQMQREKLFIWPLCMTSYEPEEGGGGSFPTYENGDIFLAWGEVGTRAYASYKPEIAVRCVNNVLGQYAEDGLAFQRYLRKTQTGEGADILSNMANPLVGLYRNIYGIQPKWNRLYLDPHLTAELAGTTLIYRLRGRDSPGDR